jgi:hypothetical protein
LEHDPDQEHGYNGLFDRRRGKNSYHRVPMATAERVLELYRDKYADFNVRHFHEKLQEVEQIGLSYSWVKQALQGEGLVARGWKRGAHRKRRARRPMPGMLLHIDGSKHRWFQDDRYYDLIVILGDASSEIYYPQLVEEESTRTVMIGVREVIERKGLFCPLYSDRGGQFFYTPRAGEPVDKSRLTQFGRALKELGVQMIPAYSPQARGRSERSFGTWQGRLPQEPAAAAMIYDRAASLRTGDDRSVVWELCSAPESRVKSDLPLITPSVADLIAISSFSRPSMRIIRSVKSFSSVFSSWPTK